MEIAEERFQMPIEVLPEDIDFYHHVNNTVYVRWVQDVATAHWDARATRQQKESVGWVVVRHELDYLKPIKDGDEVVAMTWVGTAEKNFFERFVEFRRQADGAVLARARSLYCPIDPKTMRPKRAGEDIYAMFNRVPTR